MSFKDDIKVKGEVSIVVTDKDGNLKATRDVHNMVVTTGKNHIASRIAGLFDSYGDTGAIISHIAFGTAVTFPTLTDIELGYQLGPRYPIEILYPVATNVVVMTSSYSGQTGILTEAGLFNHATAGTMICRTTFLEVPMIITDILAITWTLTIN